MTSIFPVFTVAAVMLATAGTAAAMDRRAPYQRIKGPGYSTTQKNYFNMPQIRKKRGTAKATKAFSLLRSGAIDLHSAVTSFFNRHEELVGLKLNAKNRKSLNLREAKATESYDVSFNGFNFCNANVKAMHFSNANEPVILASLPEFYAGQNVGTDDWDDFYEVLNQGLNAMLDRGFHGTRFATGSEQPCIYVSGGQMYPAWRFTLLHEALPYEAVATASELFQLDAKFFNVNGQGKAYTRNPRYPSPEAPEIENVSLVSLVGDGKLTNNVFTTRPEGIPRLENANHDFSDVNPGDQGFPEMNVFVHANHTLKWFESLGFTYDDETKLALHTNYVFAGGDINNAVYSPQNGPKILIANGGPVNGQKRLENLPLDRDVVSHEFAHHVIYQSLTTTSEGSESLVLHEGLADALTFLRTNDACLGESICPAGSTFNCFEVGACLRSAENQFVFGDPDIDRGPHIKSQFISGMIWDLKKKSGISTSVLSSIVVKAIDLLLYDSGYLHLILAMMNVDKSLYNGEHSCDIYQAAYERGLGSVLNFSCDDTLPAIDTATGQPVVGDIDRTSGSSSSVSTNGRSGSNSICGVISTPTPGTWQILLAMLMTPALLALRKREE